jgi:hypothetical protein
MHKGTNDGTHEHTAATTEAVEEAHLSEAHILDALRRFNNDHAERLRRIRQRLDQA